MWSEAAAAEQNELHIVMFPYPAFGHINAYVQLSNKLSLHGVQISFLSAPGSIARIQSSLLLTPKAHVIPLPIPPVKGLPPGLDSTSEMTPDMAELLKKALDLMQPLVKTILSLLRPHIVVFDFAQYWVPKMASELGIKTVLFSTFSTISNAYLTVPSRTRGGSIPSVEDLMKPPIEFPLTSITSMKLFEARDFMHVFKSYDSGPGAHYRILEGLSGCIAMMVRTCNEIEGPYLDFMRSQFQKPVLLTGLLVEELPSGVLEEKWAKWLAQFPCKSVVFCSFGSEAILTDDQVKELALGLELTGLPFILVLNFPAGADKGAELARVLPRGFLERVKDRGIVHTGWVQQRHILAHDSIGCHVSHAGFSSVIESFAHDCQLVLLPFRGDQFLNSKLIAGDMKAGVEVARRDEDGYFGREDIAKALNTVMVEVDNGTCGSIRASHQNWRKLFLNGDNQNKFIEDLVRELKAIAQPCSSFTKR